MQKVKDKIVPIKVKLLTIIIPAVIIAMIVLIGISYSISKDLILDYSSSLLNSSIENQANEIESWLNENLAAFQMAKNVIETTSPDDEELQKILDGYYGTNDNCAEGLYVADETGKTTKEGVYAGGDAVTGAATVILAMGAGKAGAQGIHEYLSNK